MDLIINKKEKMTPIERSYAISNGLEYDRLPMDPFLGEIKARYIGKNTREYWLNEDNLVNADIAAFNKFGYDGMGVGPNAYGIAEAIGIEANYPENGLITVKKLAIDNLDDVNNMDIIKLSSGNLMTYYNATSRLREIGDGICPVGASLSGPLTLAGFCYGTDRLLKAMIKYPDKVDRLLEYIVECVKLVIDEFSKIGISFSMADPIASTTMISPKMYKRFVYGPTQEICNYLMKVNNSKPSYHVCGNTKKIWTYIKDINFSMFSIDNEMNIHEACEYFSDYLPIAGNVDPVKIISKGDKKMIEDAVIDSIMAGKKCKKGFILTPGCNLPLYTSDENIEIFMDAGRKYSKLILQD
ncbi:uroporphyrinogen decarboxylase family protein [Peptostreptococcus anaerobius]|uniref:Methyltransferase, MtaA/CmuA family n=2 Tax=Peptostreptococcus anaerobius TaxID=1261 RepID=A0A135YNB6_9FIRM|nr:uroporphyrinogen decarboxylase family protein [Peptostreptococcus anaerobius]KXI10909.1 methyltransferase, MtaA/CmuA family [Peptostreptococcus anaerobius]